MSEVMTRADSLRRYLSGAGSNGGAQTDPNAALGHFRSSTEAVSKGISISSAIANITIDYAGGANANGAGSLECTGANTLQWKDNGGAFGAVVTIANGESKVLEEAGSPGKFIRITRTSATALVPGTATVTLSELVNNLFGFDDVSSPEASAGDDEYRGFFLKDVSADDVASVKVYLGLLGTSRVSAAAQLGASGAGTIGLSTGNFNDWPAKGWCRVENSGGTLKEIVYYSSRSSTVLTVPAAGRGLLGTSATAGAGTDLIHAVPGCRIAIDNAGVQTGGTGVQTIANEDTAPTITGSWNTSITAAAGLNVGSITPGQEVVIWIHRQTPVGAGASPTQRHRILYTFDTV